MLCVDFRNINSFSSRRGVEESPIAKQTFTENRHVFSGAVGISGYQLTQSGEIQKFECRCHVSFPLSAISSSKES